MIRAAWLGLATALAGQAAFAQEVRAIREELERHLYLQVTFDDGTADPSVNRCKAKGGINEKYERPEFVEGIRGKGLSCAGSNRCVSYQFRAMGEEGTLNYWLRNDGVNPPITQFTLSSDDTYARLYRFYENPWILIEGRGRERTFFDPAGTVGPGWNMVTIRWTATTTSSYLNGRPEVKKDNTPFITGIRAVVLGNDWANHTDYVMDELSLFDRALSDSEIAFLYHDTGEPSNEPLIGIPPVPEGKRPVLDGAVGVEEWARSAKVAALVGPSGTPAGDPGFFWLCQDSEMLYVAYLGPVPAAARNDPLGRLLQGFLEAREEKRDGSVMEDDAVGIEITPEFPLGERFLFWVNARGVRYDARWKVQPAMPSGSDASLGAAASEEGPADDESVQEEIEEEEDAPRKERSPKPDTAWNPDWRVFMKENPDRGWEVEMAIPLAEVRAAAPGSASPAPSAAPAAAPAGLWGLNLSRSWRRLATGRDTWAWGRYLASEKLLLSTGALGRAVLAGPSDPIVRLHRWAGPTGQTFEIDAEVINPSQEELTLECTLQTNAALLRLPWPVTVQPGASHRIIEQGVINDPCATRLRLDVAQVGPGGRRSLAQLGLPFVQQQKMEVVLKHHPSARAIEVCLDLSLYRERPASEFEAEVELRRGEERLARASSGKLTSHAAALNLDLSAVAPGDYAIATRVRAGDRLIESNLQSFTVRPFPEWYDNTLGFSDEPPPPYEPVRAEGRSVAVWGRSYDFTDSLLPRQVTTQGASILAGPMTLELLDGEGRSHELAAGHAPATLRVRPCRAEWSGRASLAGFHLDLSGWIEFDGFLWVTFELAGPEAARVRSLRLDIPFRKEASTLVNNYSYGLQGTGAVPPEGIERGRWPLWLGNETGGLQWLTDDSSPWFAGESPVRVLPADDHRVMSIRFIDREIVLQGPLHWSFGLIATPVRPPPREPIDNLEALADLNAVTWGYGNYHPHKTDWGNPLAWADGYGHGFRRDHANAFFPDGRESDSGPYVMLEVCAAGDSEPGRRMREFLDYWFYEWANDGKARWRPGLTGLQVSPNSKSWQDFFVWHIAELYRRHRFTGLYFDVSMPHFGDNLRAGLGCRMPDGSIAPSASVLGTRAIARRLYTWLRRQETVGQIGYHMSGMVHGALIGFCERIVDGENFYSLLSESKPENYHVLSLATFRAEYMGTNFGPITTWLPQARRRFDEASHGRSMKALFKDPDRETRWIYGIVLLHNSDLWASYVPGHADDLIEALQRYRIGNPRYHFLPYWSQPAVHLSAEGRETPSAEALAADLVASVYRQKEGDQALIVVFNNTDWSGRARLKVDWPRLGLEAAGTRVQNEMRGFTPQRDGAEIVVRVSPRDVTLVGLNGPPIPVKEEKPPEDLEKPAGEGPESDEEESDSRVPDIKE